MLNQDHRQMEVILDLMNQSGQIRCFLWIHTGCRLIQKQYLRLCGKRSGDFQTTLFPIGKIAGKLISLVIQMYHL